MSNATFIQLQTFLLFIYILLFFQRLFHAMNIYELWHGIIKKFLIFFLLKMSKKTGTKDKLSKQKQFINLFMSVLPSLFYQSKFLMFKSGGKSGRKHIKNL